MNELTVVNHQNIQDKIYSIRDVQVMLDRDLAVLYGVETRRLNEQVKRNINRFPQEFMFQLTKQEFEEWISQIATSNKETMGLRKMPFVFTEQGVSMLSAVLKSDTAVQTSIQIMSTFVNMRKFLLNQTNFDKTLPQTYAHQAKLAVKDEYNFDFLELGDQHSEYELEISLINKVREFLAQMGSDFTFIGNQYRLEIDNEEYFIDLLLYHRRLKSLIAIELKIGKFKPEYAGKMNFYLSALNDTVKLADENPSIGIIICKEKKRTTVEYALRDSNQPIGVSSTYTLSETLPIDLRGFLPTTQEIEEKLLSFFDKEKNQ